MKKVIFFFIVLLNLSAANATLSNERKIVGVVKSFDEKKVSIQLKDKVVEISKAIVMNKYKKLNGNMLIELQLTNEEFKSLVVKK
jgi:hypothetical protein